MNAFLSPAQQTTLFILALMVILVGLSWFFVRILRQTTGRAALRAAEKALAEDGEASQPLLLPEPWQALRNEVEMSNRVLTPQVFERARQIFNDYYASGSRSPAALIREYDQEEFLLMVDEHGRTPLPPKEMMDRYERTAAGHPLFKRWFHPAVLEEGEKAGFPILLAARWLCHLAGLRHITVEIFIDPPAIPGHTLIQVRGMDKFEAPGTFDIPCAGHVSGVTPINTALEKELQEELNLSLENMDDFLLLGRYNSYSGITDTQSRLAVNNEHRVLYRARLKPEAAGRIRFTDGEVAGISVFAVDELKALVQKYPERVASGLRDAIGFYE